MQALNRNDDFLRVVGLERLGFGGIFHGGLPKNEMNSMSKIFNYGKYFLSSHSHSIEVSPFYISLPTFSYELSRRELRLTYRHQS